MTFHPTPLNDASVIVIDADGSTFRLTMNFKTALTIWATCSDDPPSWILLEANWQRFRSPDEPEFLSVFETVPMSLDQAIEELINSTYWLVIDLKTKRIMTGPNVQSLGHDATLAVGPKGSDQRGIPLPFNLPPWWELTENVTTDAIKQPRKSPLQIPYSSRSILYGEPLLDFCSRQIMDLEPEYLRGVFLRTDQAKAWEQWTDEDHARSNQRHKVVLNIHRDWLMSPLDEVSQVRPGAAMPRDLLHGATDWSLAVSDGQKRRFGRGCPLIAATFDGDQNTAPMGYEERAMYFDFCREVIEAGCWRLSVEPSSSNSISATELKGFMRAAGQDWLNNPFEGGSPPSFVIECCRRRVPRGSGVPIAGISGVETESHVSDCDCPICNMMASDMFGVGFSLIDGHHLEIDGEFAFSMIESYAAWEAEQREWEARNARIEAEIKGEKEARQAVEDDDALAPIWSNSVAEGNDSSQTFDRLKLAFHLAELIGDLKFTSAQQSLIDRLNMTFRNYHQSDSVDAIGHREEFLTALESAAEQFPSVVSKSSDLQSKVEELARTG